MRIGTEIVVDAKLVRRSMSLSVNYKRERRYYEEVSMPHPITMYYIGWRMGSEGEVYHDYEDGDEYSPDRPVKYALAVLCERSNPIKIPWRIIENYAN